MMNRHIIDGAAITTWGSFHEVFSCEFSFPHYYGRNMDAWIDCMSDLFISEGIVVIEINNIEVLKEKNKEIYEALVECTAFVNWKRTQAGSEPLIALSFFK